LHLSLAAQDFDRFAFSGRIERQSEQGVAAAKVCREITQKTSIHGPIGERHLSAAAVQKLLCAFTIRSFSI